MVKLQRDVKRRHAYHTEHSGSYPPGLALFRALPFFILQSGCLSESLVYGSEEELKESAGMYRPGEEERGKRGGYILFGFPWKLRVGCAIFGVCLTQRAFVEVFVCCLSGGYILEIRKRWSLFAGGDNAGMDENLL